MEVFPSSPTHSGALSTADESSGIASSPNPGLLARAAGAAADGAVAGSRKPVLTTVMVKKGKERQCMLLGAYFVYGEVPKRAASSASLQPPESPAGKEKQICLSGARVAFDRTECSIRLQRARQGHRAPIPREKVFVTKTRADFYAWQAAITRAVALWPGPNDSSSEAAQTISEYETELGRVLAGVLRLWMLVTVFTSLDFLSEVEINAGLHRLHVSVSRRPGGAHDAISRAAKTDKALAADVKIRLENEELRGYDFVTYEEFNAALVSLMVHMPHLCVATFRSVLVSMLEHRRGTSDLAELQGIVTKLQPLLLDACEKFVSVALEYGTDLAAALWPGASRGGSADLSGDTCYSAELLRAWFARAATAPWSALRHYCVEVLAPGVQAALNVPKPPRHSPCLPGLNGIRNGGNTCYLSSVLQCLTHTSQVCRFFLIQSQQLYVGRDSRSDFLSTRLSHLIDGMWTEVGVLDAEPIVDFLVDVDDVLFSPGQQHDAHEALVTILDVLDAELCERGARRAKGAKRATKASRESARKGSGPSVASSPSVAKLPDYTSDALTEDNLISQWRAAYVEDHNSFITHYFSGQLVQKLTCPNCSASSYCCDSFTYLIAPIAERKDGDGNTVPVQLEACLEESFRSETMQLTDENRCDRCKEKTAHSVRTLELQRLPPYLIVCLNRFHMGDRGQAVRKKETAVRVPEHLSLGAWLRRAALLPILGEGGGVHYSQMDRSAEQRGSYELYGAVIHRGTISSGHYTAACRVGSNWYEFSDSTVTRLPPFSTWTDENARDLYLLFYRSTAGDQVVADRD